MTSNSAGNIQTTRWLGTAAAAVWTAIRETILDHPVALERRLQAPGATQFQLKPKQSVALSDLMRWDCWLDDLVENGAPSVREAFHRYGPLTHSHTLAEFSCTLRDVQGLVNSECEEYGDLDEMALRATNVAQDLSIANLHANLASEGRGREPTIDRGDFVRYLWDGRIFWDNPDGAHHFVAARYLAKKLGVEVALKPRRLHTVSIDETKLRELLSNWELFAMHDIFDGDLVGSSDSSIQSMPSLHECLRAAEVPHRWTSLPRPHAGCVMWIGGTARMATGTAESIERDRRNGKTALFLPRHEPRAIRAAALLRHANAFDLGAYLSNLAARQRLFA